MEKNKKKKFRSQYTKVSDHNWLANLNGFVGIISTILATIISFYLQPGAIVEFLLMMVFICIAFVTSGVNLMLNLDVVKEGYLFYTWEKDADRTIAHKWLVVYSTLIVAIGFGFGKYMLEYLFSVGFELWFLIWGPATLFFFLFGLVNLFYTFSKWSTLEKDLEEYKKEIAALNAKSSLGEKPKKVAPSIEEENPLLEELDEGELLEKQKRR